MHHLESLFVVLRPAEMPHYARNEVRIPALVDELEKPVDYGPIPVIEIASPQASPVAPEPPQVSPSLRVG